MMMNCSLSNVITDFYKGHPSVNILTGVVLFRSDKGSQSNKGRSPYLIGQIGARALPSQIRPILVR